MNETNIEADTSLSEKPSFVDLENLLKAAHSSEFDSSKSLIDKKQPFEKFSSLFDLVKTEENKIENDKENEIEKVEAPETFEEPDQSKSTINDQSPVSEMLVDDVSEKIIDDNVATDELKDQEQLEDVEQTSSNDADVTSSAETQDTKIEDEIDTSPDHTNKPDVEIRPDLTDAEQLFYKKGYEAALDEFQKAMELEKNSIQELTTTLFSMGDELQLKLEELIKEKIIELAEEFIGKQIDEIPENFIEKITDKISYFLDQKGKIVLELNHFDFQLFKSNADLSSFDYEFRENLKLRRGEFNILSDSSTFSQELS